MTGGEEALAEVAGDDIFLVADGGEVDAGVPAEEYIDVSRYIMQLRWRENSRFLAGPSAWFGMTMVWGSGRAEEWFEQLGDAVGVHGKSDCSAAVARGRGQGTVVRGQLRRRIWLTEQMNCRGRQPRLDLTRRGMFLYIQSVLKVMLWRN